MQGAGISPPRFVILLQACFVVTLLQFISLSLFLISDKGITDSFYSWIILRVKEFQPYSECRED